MERGPKNHSPHAVMPEECNQKAILDTSLPQAGGQSPTLVFITDEAQSKSGEIPSGRQLFAGFYGREQTPKKTDEIGLDLTFPLASETEEDPTISTEKKGYKFPPTRLPPHHKSSFSDNYSTITEDKPFGSVSSSRPMKFRSHSISITDPVCRSTYESIAQSPAASFLAQFAPADNWKDKPRFGDGDIVDKYRLGKVLGRGSFSECREAAIYAPEDEPATESSFKQTTVNSQDKVAMKIVKGDEEHGQNLIDFNRELAIWNKLKHKNILPLIDFLRLDNALIAISPVIENGTLLDHITKNGPLSEQAAKGVFRQICDAVSHMHTDHGLVHRDIKLDNILLDKNMCPYICDFGLCESTDDMDIDKIIEKYELESNDGSLHSSSARTRTDDKVFCKGSLWYLAPEELEPTLLKDEQGINKLPMTESKKKSDIWSLGIVLYGMIMGKLPFDDDFIPRLQVSVTSGEYPPIPSASYSSSLRDLVSTLLTVNILERPCIAKVLDHPWLHFPNTLTD